MSGVHLKFGMSPEEFLDHLTDAAYRVALARGVRGPFVDTIADIEKALRGVIRRDMYVSDVCGLFTVCEEAMHYEPWTVEAERVMSEDLMA